MARAPRTGTSAARVIATALTVVVVAGWAFAQTLDDVPSYAPSFGAAEKRATAHLVAEVAGPGERERYLALAPAPAAAYLDSFWAHHNPLIHRTFIGHHLGRRHYSVSDVFFERLDLIPKEFYTGFTEPDTAVVSQALRLAEMLVERLPSDPIALAARGYALLEAGRGEEADPLFSRAIKLKDRYAEAHNGRGLSYLHQGKRLMEALYHFRDAIASDPTYAAALYNLAMCHLAMGSIDLDHRFGMVVERFPNHHDAHFKLGVAYEDLYDFKRAAGAYSNQLIANPDHDLAKARLARVNLEMSWTQKRHYDIPEVQVLVDKDPVRYLPLLAETHLAKHNFHQADRAYRRYFRMIRGDVRAHYEDITLLVAPKEAERLRSADKDERKRLTTLFWLMEDPTPTDPVNERRLEHYRRVHYALHNFGLGQKPWDKRGEVYIRFGHPDHRSWSGNIVFETDPDVTRVKNRLNDRTFRIRHEIIPDDLRHGGEGLFPSRDLGEIRGLPVFPVPHTGSQFRDGASLDARWECWIYADVDGGIELSFVDYTGSGRFDFARVPMSSSNVHIWEELAPETVFVKAISPEPSHYVYDYGGAPLTVHLDHASFRAEDASRLELYFGIPQDELGLEMRGDRIYGQYDRQIVLYDEAGRETYRDSVRLTQPVDAATSDGLLVSLAATGLSPGSHVLGARLRDPGTGRVQVLRQRLTLEDYQTPVLALSDIQVAWQLSPAVGDGPRQFRKGDLEVIPLPSRRFSRGEPVYLYYEVYNLLQDRNGQTRYRVDYEVRGGAPDAARRLLGQISRFLGRDQRQNTARISYEHEGFDTWEPLYVALDLTAEGKGEVEIRVVVTDLKQLDEPFVSRTTRLTIGE